MGRGNKGKQIFGILLLVTFLLSLGFVSSATGNVTILAPTTGSTLSGTVLLNVTNMTTTFDQMKNCSFYFKSPSTANNSWTLVGTFNNNTLYNVNGTFSASVLEDANDYVMNATCRNLTNDIAWSTVTGLILNSTVPDAPTISPADYTTKTTSGSQTFTGTVTDSKTTSCTCTFYRGGSPSDSKSCSAIYSGSTCSFSQTFSSTTDNGVWYATVTASDGSETKSTTSHFNVVLPGQGGGQLPLSTSSIFTKENAGSWVMGIIIVLAIITLIIILVTNKRKRR